ncbi:unnamed protein product [Cylicostephanus goldi]|uniref:GH18 domain-containing protein n=1 Tax=Cylicostephanus goldi TaxID=71465 RepID=A0A3P7QRI8_CYLGO|nr:unnamed protein product [Cylicostephanus goldi]
MQAYLIFLSLISLCFAKAAPGNQTFYNYAYALDLSGAVPYNTFTCIKSNGYSTVFVRAYDPSAGLGTEVFMTPLLRSMKRGSEQFRELYDGLRYGNIQLRTVWIQVTSPVNWGPNVQENINFINDIIMAANEMRCCRDVYTMNTMKHQVGLRQKLDGKIVVGLLGSTIGFVQSV